MIRSKIVGLFFSFVFLVPTYEAIAQPQTKSLVGVYKADGDCMGPWGTLFIVRPGQEGFEMVWQYGAGNDGQPTNPDYVAEVREISASKPASYGYFWWEGDTMASVFTDSWIKFSGGRASSLSMDKKTTCTYTRTSTRTNLNAASQNSAPVPSQQQQRPRQQKVQQAPAQIAKAPVQNALPSKAQSSRPPSERISRDKSDTELGRASAIAKGKRRGHPLYCVSASRGQDAVNTYYTLTNRCGEPAIVSFCSEGTYRYGPTTPEQTRFSCQQGSFGGVLASELPAGAQKQVLMIHEPLAYGLRLHYAACSADTTNMKTAWTGFAVTAACE